MSSQVIGPVFEGRRPPDMDVVPAKKARTDIMTIDDEFRVSILSFRAMPNAESAAWYELVAFILYCIAESVDANILLAFTHYAAGRTPR